MNRLVVLFMDQIITCLDASSKIVFFFVNRLISEDPVSMVVFVVEEHDIVVNM